MTDQELFCPACSAEAHIVRARVTTCRSTGKVAQRSALTLVCTNCPVVSEVSRKGNLLDLGMRLTDLAYPSNERDHVYVTAPALTPIRGRGES